FSQRYSHRISSFPRSASPSSFILSSSSSCLSFTHDSLIHRRPFSSSFCSPHSLSSSLSSFLLSSFSPLPLSSSSLCLRSSRGRFSIRKDALRDFLRSLSVRDASENPMKGEKDRRKKKKRPKEQEEEDFLSLSPSSKHKHSRLVSQSSLPDPLLLLPQLSLSPSSSESVCDGGVPMIDRCREKKKRKIAKKTGRNAILKSRNRERGDANEEEEENDGLLSLDSYLDRLQREEDRREIEDRERRRLGRPSRRRRPADEHVLSDRLKTPSSLFLHPSFSSSSSSLSSSVKGKRTRGIEGEEERNAPHLETVRENEEEEEGLSPWRRKRRKEGERIFSSSSSSPLLSPLDLSPFFLSEKRQHADGSAGMENKRRNLRPEEKEESFDEDDKEEEEEKREEDRWRAKDTKKRGEEEEERKTRKIRASSQGGRRRRREEGREIYRKKTSENPKNEEDGRRNEEVYQEEREKEEELERRRRERGGVEGERGENMILERGVGEDFPLDRGLLARQAQEILQILGLSEFTVSIHLVTPEEMRSLNEESRQISESTDVLSFPSRSSVAYKRLRQYLLSSSSSSSPSSSSSAYSEETLGEKRHFSGSLHEKNGEEREKKQRNQWKEEEEEEREKKKKKEDEERGGKSRWSGSWRSIRLRNVSDMNLGQIYFCP
ncbi:phosphopantetheine--protein transferase domain containing, partial [Cystoisospora suis]